jgi:transposase-like protein
VGGIAAEVGDMLRFNGENSAYSDKAEEWQNSPLQPVFAIVFMDALFLKLRVEGRVKNVADYLMVGIDLEGNKECLGICLGQTESAKYTKVV